MAMNTSDPIAITCTSRFDGSETRHLLDDALLVNLSTITGVPVDALRANLLLGEKVWTDFTVYERADHPIPPSLVDPTQDAARRLKADIKHIAEQFLDRINEDDFVDEADPENIGPLEAVRETMIAAYSEAFCVTEEFVQEILDELHS